MTFFAGLALTLVFLALLRHRVTLAVENVNITGLLYNPLLYLYFFAYFYLVMGSMLAPAGQALIGFVFYQEASEMATWLCYYYFVIIAAFYFISRDRRLSYTESELGIPGEIALVLTVLLLPYAYYTLATYGPGLALLQGNRYAAMQYFSEAFTIGSHYGQVFCIVVTSCVLYKLRYPHDWKSNAVFLIGTLPFLITDYLQNARGSILAIFTLFYILTCTRRQKLYITPAIVVVVSLLIFGVVLRTDYRSFDLSTNLLSALSEFYLTRSSVDFVIGSNTDVGLFHLLSSSLDRILPGIGKSIDPSNVMFFTEYIEKTMNLSFGLAGNIVSESYYYGGMSFALAAPFVIASIYLMIAHSRAICYLPGFVFNIFMIGSTQMMIRNGFFYGIFTLIGLMLIHLAFITYLGRHVKVLEEQIDDPRELHEPA